MEGCFRFDLRWVHVRLGAVAKARFDTHHLEEYDQTSATLEKAISALAQLEGELSRRSETASAHLVNNSISTKMKHFPLEGVVIFLMKSRAQSKEPPSSSPYEYSIAQDIKCLIGSHLVTIRTVKDMK
ncbi:hypothetical protein Tco_1034576 [Tanacetum coccineum]